MSHTTPCVPAFCLIVNRVLNVGETYRGVELCAVSPADPEQKRREVDRAFARRLFDAPNAETRALILKELHFAPPTKPRAPRRRAAETEAESGED